ncbi:MAG: hypothetical protein Q9202_004074 [Teloschistes flavicans]
MSGLNAELKGELGRFGRPLDMEAEAKKTQIRLEAEGGREDDREELVPPELLPSFPFIL